MSAGLDDGLLGLALSDADASSSTPASGKTDAATDAASARARRIAAAVARSRTEYTPEHAYTERGWITGAVAGPSKVDRQHVEYASSWRLAHGVVNADEAAHALADVLACAGSRPLKSLPRELLSTGLTAALVCNDAAHAQELARAARSYWRAYVGLAITCSDALAADPREAVHPLIHSTATALHYPVLQKLEERLRALAEGGEAGSDQGATSGTTNGTTNGTSGDDGIAALARAVGALATSRAWAFSAPLFDDAGDGDGGDDGAEHDAASTTTRRLRPPPPPSDAAAHRAALTSLDLTALAAQLDLTSHADGPKLLSAAVGRLARALGGRDDEPEVAPGERVERGVREL